MKPDLNKYLPMMDGYDMTHEQKIQFIHDLWHIMESFVDRAFGTHPLQQCSDKNYNSNLHDSMKRLESFQSTKSSEKDLHP